MNYLLAEMNVSECIVVIDKVRQEFVVIAVHVIYCTAFFGDFQQSLYDVYVFLPGFRSKKSGFLHSPDIDNISDKVEFFEFIFFEKPVNKINLTFIATKM